MNPAYVVPIFMVLLIVSLTLLNQRRMMIRKLINKRKTEDKDKMTELAKKFIDKECLIYTFSGSQIEGVIKEVSDSALLVENRGAVEAVNIDFVIRIREYPRKKNGKKKSVVLD